jgi:hypothetical protein
MITYRKLSPAQKRVVDMLNSDRQFSYCKMSVYYNYQVIFFKQEQAFFSRATFDFLVKNEILVRGQFNRYVLNKQFIIR